MRLGPRGTLRIRTEAREGFEEVALEGREERFASIDPQCEGEVRFRKQLPGRSPRVDERSVQVEQDGAWHDRALS